MLYTSLAITFLLASASAVPVFNIEKREDKTLYSSEQGDIRITLSNTAVQLGQRNPGDIMGMLQKACGDSICEPAPMTLDTRLYTKTTDVTYNINVKPEGDFKPEDRQKLFDMLNAAAWTAMTCDVVKYRKETCPPSPMPGICILPDAEDKVICQAPKYWAVQLGDNSGNLMVSLDSSEDKSDQQWCEKMMGKGGEIAGAVNGAAGMGFSVGAIGCKMT